MLSCYVRQLIDVVSRVLFGLRFRLLLLVLLACAPLVGLTLHTASKERRREVADWRERARQLTQACAPGRVRVAQTDPRNCCWRCRELSAVQSGNREDCKKSLEEAVASYPGYANLGVIDTNGEVLASAPPLVEPGNQAGRTLFRRVLAGRGALRDRRLLDRVHPAASRPSLLAIRFSTNPSACRPSSLQL